MILILMLIMMLKFCVKESSNLTGIENLWSQCFPLLLGWGWYSPFLHSPHESLTASIVT